jgi:hypothetical protein
MVDMATTDRLRGVLLLAAALGGFVVAVIVVLNLHIVVGLEEGYAASPREVGRHSTLLVVADIALLLAGPTVAVMAARKARRR